MDSQIKTSHNKMTLIVSSIVILLLLIVVGLFVYQQYNSLNQVSIEQQIVNDAAKSASSVNLSDAQKSKIITDIQKEPAIKLSPKEATKREMEIINKVTQ